MPNFTPNYNLEKPLVNESYSIGVFNANSDKIDTAIKVVSNNLDANIANYNFTAFAGDVKTINKSGNFYCNSSNTSTPYSSNWYISVIVREGQENSNRKIQAKRSTTNQEYTMYMDNGVWSSWQLESRGSVAINHFVTVSGTNNLTGSSAAVALEEGLELTIKIASTNTGNVTLNFNSNGAKSVLRNGNIQLSSGSLLANGIYKVIYDGTNFILLEESGVRIKSVQRGTINFNGSAAAQAVPISTVNMSKSIVKIQVSSNATTAQTALIAAQITSPTNVALYKGVSNTSACQVFWEVVEYEGNVVVQRGRSELPDGTQEMNVSISEVDISKTINITTNVTIGGSTAVPAQKVSGRVVTSTNLTLYRISDEGTAPTYWQVLEFK